MSGAPVDPLQILQAAFTAPPNSPEQDALLNTLRDFLEAHPATIPVLLNTFISVAVNQEDSLLKRWVVNLLHFAICRSTLSIEQKTTLSHQCLDMLSQLLENNSTSMVKLAIQCFTGVYPLLFRQLCITKTNPHVWNTLSNVKARILGFVWAQEANGGVKLCAVKFMQRVVLVQTRGVSDPRLQKPSDPNLAICPADHPFISGPMLEQEGQKLLEAVITLLYSSSNTDILTALLNSWSQLTKLRPAIVPLVVTALKSWTPAALVSLPASNVKSVEKALRILLVHISRIPNCNSFIPQINEALSQQQVRMEKAVMEEKQRKAAALAIIESRKRPNDNEQQPSDAKRQKLESGSRATSVTAPATTTATPANALSFLADFDFTSLPPTLITDLIVANLEAFSENDLMGLIEAYRQRRCIAVTEPVKVPAPTSAPPQTIPTEPAAIRAASAVATTSALSTTPPARPTTPPPPKVKDEPLDPLAMDIDEEDLVYEPEQIDLNLSGGVSPMDALADTAVAEVDLKDTLLAVDFKLPPPRELHEDERTSLIEKATKRIFDGATLGDTAMPVDSEETGASAADMWMLMLIRMITRVAKPPPELEGGEEPGDADMEDDERESKLAKEFYRRQDQQRQTLCDYIIADFPGRMRLATLWMNEEWYNDEVRLQKDRYWQPNYDTWLNQIVAAYQTHIDGKDRTFTRFLLDLPSVPPDVLSLLRDMCLDNERMPVGFNTLRGFVVQRPSLRTESLTILLELTTHPEKVTRTAAINTVRPWVSGMQPMDGMVRDFALQMLRKLQSRSRTKRTDGDAKDGDEAMEDGQLTPEEIVQTPYLPEYIELPAQKAQVLQHVELLFALCVKVPNFLDEIFEAYGSMDVTVQEAIQQLITALIRSLGSNNGKLLTLMRNFPPGAETLALRVLAIFTDNGRPSSQMVALIKALITERDLDARFLIPIIAEMDKPDIMRHLPRIVSILDGSQEPKNLVRSVFSSVVTTPPQTFGSVSSNMPRVRQSELLTPAELMVLLHESEKEISLKSAKEAIGICFSMTDVFRSEILAVVMQQIMDEPVLPVLFLRTVIQAVTTYKSLVGFVSTTLLSRLITKKIWTNPPLWEGFIHCAKVIAPASFGALLQLPKDQLRELVDKQPSLKAGLRDYVTKKAGNKARAMAGFMDIFGDPDETGSAPATPPPQSVTPPIAEVTMS